VLNSDRRPTIEKSTKLRSEEPADASALRIRISDMPDNEHASLPAPIPANSRTMKSLSTGEGSVVRIRDRSDELQLASAHEAAPVASASSRRSQQVIVSDLFAPPPGERTPVAANAMPQKAASAPQASAVVTNVQSVRSQGDSVKAMGRVSDIDSRSGSIRFTFKTEQAPAKGALVKVYHHFLLGQECTGALEITGVQKGVATARPVGNLNINKISLDDEVAFQSAAFVPTVQPAAVIASDTP
jgi:hypothetical protein